MVLLTFGHDALFRSSAPPGCAILNFWESGRRSIARAIGVDLTHTQEHYARVLETYVQPGGRWLEVGCGRQIVPDWAMSLARQRQLAERAEMLVGMDVDAAVDQHPLLTHRVRGLGNAMPFQSDSFHLVTANMVVEHVHHPEELLLEIQRILQPGGRFVFHTTNFGNMLIFIAYFVPDRIKEKIVWILEKRKAEDIFPTRYEINTVRRIREVVSRTSLSIERLSLNGTAGAFGGLGPIGWVELLLMKAVEIGTGQYNSNLICVLRRS